MVSKFPKCFPFTTLFSFKNKKMSQGARSGKGCCFWSNTTGCLGPCKPEHYHDEGSNSCLFTFLVFLFVLLRADVAVSLCTHAG